MSVEKAIADSFQVVSEQDKKSQHTLVDSYAAAEGLKRELEDLRDRAGSQFNFTEKARSDGAVVFTTNIPVAGRQIEGFIEHYTLDIVVRPNGKMAAYGDKKSLWTHKSRAKSSELGAAEKIATFVVKYAVMRELISPPAPEPVSAPEPAAPAAKEPAPLEMSGEVSKAIRILNNPARSHRMTQ